MKVDIRGHRLASDEVLSIEEQTGVIQARDEEELDDIDDDLDSVQWIPNGRTLRNRRARSRQPTSNHLEGTDSEDDSLLSLRVGDSNAASQSTNNVPEDIQELVDAEQDYSRRKLIEEGWNRQNRLIASDIADLSSVKLKSFLSLSDELEAQVAKVADLPKKGNATLLTKGAGCKGGNDEDFTFSVDTDLY